MKVCALIMLLSLAAATVCAQDIDTKDPAALVQLAQGKMADVARLAADGQFGPASALLQQAFAGFDRAVALAPNDLEVRVARGLTYAAFPAFYGKRDIAREDLELAMSMADFKSLPETRRARATTMLNQLKAPATHADRFPKVSEDVSPLMVVLSITFPVESFHERAQAETQTIANAIEGFPGLLAKHFVASIDKPGMFLIFTWWKTKKEASEFYYSDLHQGWMTQRGQTIMNGAVNIPSGAIPSQVAVEIFSLLPDGIQLNGGLIPAQLFKEAIR